MAQCEKTSVDFRFNKWAQADDVRAEKPDVVIVATGGLPNTSILELGEDLVLSTWDILSGDVKPGSTVLLFDDNGGQPGLQAAELIAEAGSALEIITPERFFAPDVGGLNHVHYARCFESHDVKITINRRLLAARRQGNQLIATVGSDYSDRRDDRTVDQIVVEHGTQPLDELYFDLKEGSINRGEVDHSALIEGRAQDKKTNRQGTYQLFRIGDAVSSRNVHAAIYDALRLCKDL